LRKELPAIEPWLAGYRDNLTLEMMRFRHFTEDALARGDLGCVRECFRLLKTAFDNGNPHLRNSVVVSYLEHLDFKGAEAAAAQRLLPADLAAARSRVRAALERLNERPAKRTRVRTGRQN
jgi:hypothetical protein